MVDARFTKQIPSVDNVQDKLCIDLSINPMETAHTCWMDQLHIPLCMWYKENISLWISRKFWRNVFLLLIGEWWTNDSMSIELAVYKGLNRLNYSMRSLYFLTSPQSYFPLTTLSLTPGVSCKFPPRTNTMLCSCRVWPSPGTYAVISLPLLSRTRTHLRLAEFGFFGFLIRVFSTTPLSCGRPSVALGLFLLFGAPFLCIHSKDAPPLEGVNCTDLWTSDNKLSLLNDIVGQKDDIDWHDMDCEWVYNAERNRNKVKIQLQVRSILGTKIKVRNCNIMAP